MDVNDPIPNVLGTIAVSISLCSQAPQVYKTIKSRDFTGVSIPTYILIFIASVLWIIYGALLHSIVLVVSSGVQIIFSSIMLVTYCIEKHKKILIITPNEIIVKS